MMSFLTKNRLKERAYGNEKLYFPCACKSFLGSSILYYWQGPKKLNLEQSATLFGEGKNNHKLNALIKTMVQRSNIDNSKKKSKRKLKKTYAISTGTTKKWDLPGT